MAQRRRSARRQAARQRRPESPEAPAAARRRRGSTGMRQIPKALVVIVGVFVVVIVAGVVANYWVSVKRPGQAPILQVNSTIFDWNDYVRLLKFQKLGAESLGSKFDSGQAPYALMQTMAENELIRQAATREGLRVTSEQVSKEMISRLLPDAKGADDPSQVDREFSVKLRNYLTTVQVTRAEYERIVETDLLREELRQKLGLTIPRVQPHAYLHLIKVADADADKVTERLKKAEEFASIARKLSTDDSRENGGEVGWVPRLVYKDMDTILFGLRDAALSEPVQGTKGWWLIKPVERVGDKARLKGVLVDTGEAARDVEKKIESGLPIEDAAAQFSTDPAVRANRGDLGLVGVGEFSGVFDVLIRGIAPGKVSDRIGTTDGTLFIVVTDRTVAREVSDKNLDLLKTRALEDWVRREWDANKVNYCPGGPNDCFSNTKVDRALAQIRDVSLTKSQQAATATAQAVQRGQQGQQIPR